MREKIVLWGAGICGKEIMQHRDLIAEMADITGVIDGSEEKQGKFWEGYRILAPRDIAALKFDKVVVTSDKYFREIKNLLIMQYDLPQERIENNLYFAKRKLQLRYQNSSDKEIMHILNYLKSNPLEVFNYSFADKYKNMQTEIRYDAGVGMYYVIHNERPLYMAKHLNTIEKVRNYYRGICMEQDTKSPHAYLDECFHVDEGDIVLDVGVAEGNFSLEVIDRASKIYMVEADKEWTAALRCTFSEFAEKTVIINAFVSDFSAFNIAVLDELIDGTVNFIKMDIEGSEAEALRGARRLMHDAEKLKCVICAYHNNEDEMIIKHILDDYGLSCKATAGYMFFPEGEAQRFLFPKLRKGLIKGEKERV